MTRERIVVDTNVLISGLLSSTSIPALALEKAITDGQLLGSTATLRELIETLLSSKFDRYVSREKRDALLLRLAPLIEIVTVVQIVQASRDAKDDKFLEVAVNGRADVIVTGDRDLVALNPFRGIAILTPADYVRRPHPHPECGLVRHVGDHHAPQGAVREGGRVAELGLVFLERVSLARRLRDPAPCSDSQSSW